MKGCATRFGERMAATLGEGPSASSLFAQEAAIVQRLQKLERSRSWLPGAARFAGVAAGVLILVGLALVLRGVSTEAESESLVGVVVSTDDRPAETLSLPDGSSVVVKPGSLAELRQVDRQWTEMDLSRGQLDLDVRKRAQAHFAVRAGPYRVLVVGTRFRVGFDDQERRLSVSVSEGEVRVFGNGLPAEGKSVAAGNRFEHSNVSDAPKHQQFNASELEPKARAQADAPKPAAPRPRAAAPRPSEAPAAGWRELAKQGKYAEAYERAESQGFDGLVRNLPAGDLLMLANSARFAGSPQRARRAFLELRTRFSGRPAAVLASFYLARIALDNDGNSAEAARWFRTYLGEAPAGQLAAGARVDLMNLLLKQGDKSGAERVARDYLLHHPTGAHRGVARSLVERADDDP